MVVMVSVEGCLFERLWH